MYVCVQGCDVRVSRYVMCIFVEVSRCDVYVSESDLDVFRGGMCMYLEVLNT